ncbi:hypothetical protein Leryth_017177 [Lithospermum erythrorhizon]|nr:hypothetical protein Leryth_017177 [Lithospermum erythrorhizon]
MQIYLNIRTFNILVDVLSKQGLIKDAEGKVDYAWKMFEGILHKGLKYDVIIRSYDLRSSFRVDRSRDALKLFL